MGKILEGPKSRWKLSRLSIGLLVVLLITVPFATMDGQANWITNGLDVKYNNPTLYPGEKAQISIIVTPNLQVSTDLKSGYITIDWDGTSTDYTIITSTVTVVAGGKATLTTQAFTVPQVTTGYKTMSIHIVGRANGDWLDSTYSSTAQLQVATRPALALSVAASPTSGESPLQVSFTSTVSGGTPQYSYQWSFGDGQTSSSANPSHSYSTAGDYTATLVVTDALSRQTSATAKVHVTSALTVQTSTDKTEGTGSLTVHFTATTTGGSPSYSYYWDFGDGTFSSEQNPAHTYSKAGNFTATLTVTDSASMQKTYNYAISVKADSSPVAGLGGLTIPLVLVVIIVIVIIIALFLMKKGKKPVQNAPPQQFRPGQ